jgi:hypothetical protein
MGLVLLGLFGSQLVGALVALVIMGGDVEALQTALANPAALGDEGRYLLLGLQGFASLGTFVLPPILLVWGFQKRSLWSFSPRPITDNMQLLWTILLIPAMAPLLELTISWNKNLTLPEFLQPVEAWALEQETRLGELTTFLIAFSSFWQFLLGLLVVAVLPAIGEELLFRGTLQPMLVRVTGSPHRGIWLAAIIFSAIHVQFYGFVPRMLLGAMFGYLYYWSGNISIPMLAHFVNNGVTVVLSYLSQQGQSDLDPENLPPAPLFVLILSGLAGVAVLYRFYQRYHLPFTTRQV